MAVSVRMTGDERDLVRAQENVAKGAANITAQYRTLTKEAMETNRFAKRAWDDLTPPLQKYQQQMQRLKTQYQEGNITVDQYRAGVEKLNLQQDQLGVIGSRAWKMISSQMGGVIGPLMSIGAAIGIIKTGIDNSVESTRQLAQTTQETMKEIVAFAAMQEKGAGRDRAMRVLEASRGRATFGEAFDIQQGMQSAAGDFEKGLAVTKDILAATLLDIPAALGREVATQALSQGEDPRAWLRGIYMAGEISKRDPKIIAPAAPGLQAFTDKYFGMAVAAQLAGTFGPELMPYTRQAGYGLSGVSPAKDWFARQGLKPTATEQQRLAILAREGMTSVEQLELIGFTEIRQAGAIQNLVKNYQTVMRYEKGINEGVRTRALLAEKRAGVEADWPEARITRMIGEEQSRFREARAFSRRAVEEEYRQRVVSAELAQRGITEGALGMNLYDQEGKLNWWKVRMQQFLPGGGAAAPVIWAAEKKANEELEAIRRNTTPAPPRPKVATPEQ